MHVIIFLALYTQTEYDKANSACTCTCTYTCTHANHKDLRVVSEGWLRAHSWQDVIQTHADKHGLRLPYRDNTIHERLTKTCSFPTTLYQTAATQWVTGRLNTHAHTHNSYLHTLIHNEWVYTYLVTGNLNSHHNSTCTMNECTMYNMYVLTNALDMHMS